MIQETYDISDPIRCACDAITTAHAHRLAEHIDLAISSYGIAHGVTSLSLAFHIQAVLQGAFIMAKAKGNPEIARDSVTHLKRYVELLFQD